MPGPELENRNTKSISIERNIIIWTHRDYIPLLREKKKDKCISSKSQIPG